MNTFHVVYRSYDQGPEEPKWAVYSFPAGVYIDEESLTAARTEFHEAAWDLFGSTLRSVPILEHLEHLACEDVYLRVAVDRHSVDRHDVARAFSGWLRGGPDAAQRRQQFRAQAPRSASGDWIVVACVARDSISWLIEQMDPHDAIAVCATGALTADRLQLPWTFLVRDQDSSLEPPAVEGIARLSEWGLDVNSTVGELLAQDRGGSEVPRGVLFTA